MCSDKYNIYYDGVIYTDIPTDVTASELEKIMDQRRESDTFLDTSSIGHISASYQRSISDIGSKISISVGLRPYSGHRFSNHTNTNYVNSPIIYNYSYEPDIQIFNAKSMISKGSNSNRTRISLGVQCEIEKEILESKKKNSSENKQMLKGFSTKNTVATQTIESGDNYYYDKLVPIEQYNNTESKVDIITSEEKKYVIVRDNEEKQRIDEIFKQRQLLTDATLGKDKSQCQIV